MNTDEADNDELNGDTQPFNCSREEHSTLDSKYITLHKGDIAWLMVSHAKLSKEAIKKILL